MKAGRADLSHVLDHVALFCALELEDIIGPVQLLPQDPPLSMRLTAVHPPVHPPMTHQAQCISSSSKGQSQHTNLPQCSSNRQGRQCKRVQLNATDSSQDNQAGVKKTGRLSIRLASWRCFLRLDLQSLAQQHKHVVATSQIHKSCVRRSSQMEGKGMLL